jgi:hypothetical protein
VCLSVVGCSRADHGAGALPATGDGTVVVSPTSTSPGMPVPVPPTPQHTDAGATAFAAHYARLLDYTFATRNTTPLLQASDKRCSLCTGLAHDVGRYRTGGYGWTGGRIATQALHLGHMTPAVPGTALVVVDVTVSELRITTPNGHCDPYSEAAHPRAQFSMVEHWSATAWVVADLWFGTPTDRDVPVIPRIDGGVTIDVPGSRVDRASVRDQANANALWQLDYGVPYPQTCRP